jgi:pre-rRNA-processing protein TSR3
MEKPTIMVLLFREDDPSKNTALKLVRAGLAWIVRKREIRGYPLILNPYANEYVGPWHREVVLKYGILVVDASWKKLEPRRFQGLRGVHGKLPPLLPGNPINYGKLCILSSIEAVAAALYITGFKEAYSSMLGLYKWMNTFHTLNAELLEEYANAKSKEDLEKIISTYWGSKEPCMYNIEEG